MNKIVIIADSTSDLPEELYSQYNIDIISLKISFGTETYVDRQTINAKKLFEYVAEKGTLPKTAAPTIHEFVQIFKKHLEQKEEIIYCGISSEFSSTYANAVIARGEFSEEQQEKIRCLDSRSLSSGIGLILCELCELVKQGKTLDEVYETGKTMVDRVNAEFVVDTMDYLYKGGRCSGVSYYFGTRLHLHPVIRVEKGKMVVHKITRGKIEKGIDLQIEEFKTQFEAKNVVMNKIFITSPVDSEDLDSYVLQKVKNIVGPEYENKLIISHAGSIISSHCGPRTIGILYITKTVVI